MWQAAVAPETITETESETIKVVGVAPAMINVVRVGSDLVDVLVETTFRVVRVEAMLVGDEMTDETEDIDADNCVEVGEPAA